MRCWIVGGKNFLYLQRETQPGHGWNLSFFDILALFLPRFTKQKNT